jgi:ferredoxin
MCAREIEKPKYEIVGELERSDEADNAQARGELIPDSRLWKDYFSKHPEWEAYSREWLKLPPLGAKAPAADGMMLGSMFETIGLMSTDEILDGPPAPQKILMSPERYTEKIKGFAHLLGADMVRIGNLNPAWVYSHVGRSHYPGKKIGPAINLPHNSAIVVAVPLNLEMVRQAPELGINMETFRNYLKLATIVVTLAKYIRALGYAARAHDLQNYQILMIPVAIDAGLGELGRNGALITEKYGNAVKIAAVTTDIPLVHDKPVDIGVDEFCRECRLCGEYCPVGAIPIKQEKKVVRGVRKWKLNDNACYDYWRKVSSDCGICLAICPWSRPRHFPHNLVQKSVQNSALARKIAINTDRLRRRKRAKTSGWMEPQPEDWITDLRRDHPFKDNR